jgi:hypothetical protein
VFGYIGRHWRGELSLPQSYWVNGVLIGLPFNVYFRVLSAVFAATPPESPSTYVYYFMLPFLAYQPIAVWQGVGIWRSAGRRIAEGKRGWSWVARIVVLGNVAVLLAAFYNYGRLNYALLNLSLEERAARYEVLSHGNYVVFHGEITVAAADKLAPLLEASKTRRLVINGSNGGFIRPTLRLAKIIHDRKLMVVAIGECDSACTALLAAAPDRAISSITIIGLHRGSIAGVSDPGEAMSGWSKIEAYYKAAGMTPQLIARMRAHSGERDFYEPTMREMIAGGFLTEIFDVEDNRYVAASAWCIQRKAECDRTGRQNREAKHAAGG